MTVTGQRDAGTAARRFAVAAVVIDLDGTLLDTVPDLAHAANAMRVECGLAELPQATIAQYVGKGVEVLVHRALSESMEGRAGAERFEPAYRSFMRIYGDINGSLTRDYPGVREGLVAMRAAGLRLACVTNKPIGFAQALLARTGLAEYFEFVLGGDSLPTRKPDPAPMLAACARFGLPPARVLAIGDSLNDALAARAARMPVVAVPYGYNEGHDPATLDVDAIVATLLDACDRIDPVAT